VKDTNYFINSDITEVLSYRLPNDRQSSFQEFVIRNEKAKKGIYRRFYKKIQNLIAEIGGLM
jgi:hypothetical protein